MPLPPPFSMGPLRLSSPLVLAPLAGYTNLPFRLTTRELSGASLGLCTTDLVNARSLLEKNPKALRLSATCAEDSPVSVQLFGSVPEEMRDAAAMLEGMGVAAVDVNMGCPVKKVCSVGGGSAMMTSLDKTAALVRGMVEAVKIPVTCKMRLGWDAENLTAPDLARALADVGVAAITVHGRTRAQGFSGSVNLEGIARVVEAVPGLPVIGNGDVTTPEGAHAMLEATGCAGISIGRGAFYNPWIFRHTMAYLERGALPPEPAFEERLQVMRRHLDRMVDFFGESLGCTMFRKIGPWYAKRLGPASFFNKRIVRLETRAQLEEILAQYVQWRGQFLDERGELLPRYRTAEAEASAQSEEASPAAATREKIPVPTGPVEWW